jgi:hypothetical protein
VNLISAPTTQTLNGARDIRVKAMFVMLVSGDEDLLDAKILD